MRSQNLLKLFSAIFFLLTFSCEKQTFDDPVEEDSGVQSKRTSTTLRKVTLDEIPEIASFLESKVGSTVFSRSSKDNDPIIDVDNILAITDSLKRTNYTFTFMPTRKKKKKYKGPRLYNLIIGVDSLGRKSNPMVLRFKPKKQYEEDWIEHDFDFGHFTGKVSLHKFTDYFSNRPFSKTDQLCPPELDGYGDPIYCVVDEVVSGGTGGASSGGGAFAPTDDKSGPCSYKMTWNYCGGENENISHSAGPAPICGGDGSGAGWVMEVDCPNFTETELTYFLKQAVTSKTSSDCPDCSTGPSGDVAIYTFAKSVLKLEWHLNNKLDYQLRNSELTWLNMNDDVAFKINQYVGGEGYSSNSLELAKWAVKIEMLQEEVPCGIGHDCIKSIQFMSDGLRKFHGDEGTLMANYLDSLISDYGSFTNHELFEFYKTAKRVTRDFNDHMFNSIVLGFVDGVKPIVEIALFEVGASVTIKLLSKLPAIVKTTRITEVLNNLKITNSLSKFKYAQKFGFKSYAQHKAWFDAMKIRRSELGVQIHHLIEQRFANNPAIANWLGSNHNNWKSIVLTTAEHKEFTDAWRIAIGYKGKPIGSSGFRTLDVPLKTVKIEARKIYKDYPDILNALGL